MSLEYNKNIIKFAKELRKNATRQEKHLWYDFLRTYPIRFQRQKAIGNYIADFYCHQAKLVIELDGSQHYTPEGREYDAVRSEVLENFDLSILRFSNEEVDNNFNGVCNTIDNAVNLALWIVE